MKNYLEFATLIIFFIAYKKYGVIVASLLLSISAFLLFIYQTIKENKVAILPLVTTILVTTFGFLTWIFKDPFFIKIKPTIINIIFALAFLVGFYMKKPLLKYLFQNSFYMEDKIWLKLSFRWALFFLFSAFINEIIRLNFSEEIWVNFKVFGFLTMTIIFTLIQLPYMLRHQIKAEAIEGSKE